jgi:Dickkopf N-terminal cysteine-rich region
MRSMKLLACVLVLVSAWSCKKDDDGDTGSGVVVIAGNGAGTAAVNSDGGSAGTGSIVTDAGGVETDAGGGDTDAGLTPIEAPPEVADVAAALVDGICGAFVACLGSATLTEQLGGEDCKARFNAEFLSGEFAYLQDSIDTARVKLEPSQLAACTSGLKAMGCGIETDSFPDACEKAVAGQVAVGDECVISSDCVGTAYCRTEAECPSHCAALLKAGDSCAKDEECGDALVCQGGKCASPGAETDACEGATGVECGLGLVCWDANDEPVKAGTCNTTDATLSGDEGDECSPGSVLCKDGLSCAYSDSSSTQFACAKAVGSGDKCFLSLPGQCPSDEYCDAADVATEGTCTKKPAEGDDCIAGVRCAPSHVCVPDGSGGGVCRHVQNNGGTCKIDDVCRSGYCNAAKCEPPPVCN